MLLFFENNIPAKKPSGTDITNAHGQDITKNVKALFIQTEKLLPKIMTVSVFF